MSKFHYEDLVIIKNDASLIGTITQTWSDLDIDPPSLDNNVYIHRDLAEKFKDVWYQEARLSSGLVMVQFAKHIDGFCIVEEKDLTLVDRSLTTGDIVRKHLSDIESGIVMSTSIDCIVEPVSSLEDYSRSHPSPIGLKPPQGFQIGEESPSYPSSRSFAISAQELKHWRNFREQDFIVYRDWIGCVQEVIEEVSIRLSNGSVVVVENPEELEEPYYVPGTPTYLLARHLYSQGFYQISSMKPRDELGNARTAYLEHYCPGIHVQTKKGNLRRGRWTFGAYNPNVLPQGIIVDVRIIKLDVDWLCGNILKNDPPPPPHHILEVGHLQGDEVRLYDHNVIPAFPIAPTLPGASYSPDTEFGNLVRLRDPGRAAIKYAASFKRIPRTDTQGYDMNVMRIVSTKTNALVRWQDGTFSVHPAISLIPSADGDDYEVWPGDKVSFKPDEEELLEADMPWDLRKSEESGSRPVITTEENEARPIIPPETNGIRLLGVPESNGQRPIKTAKDDELHLVLKPEEPGSRPWIRLQKVGVVQKVNALERFASVCWFEDVHLGLDPKNFDQNPPSMVLGSIGDKAAEVSIYDLAAYSAFEIALGDLVIVLPTEQTNEPKTQDIFNYFGQVVDTCLDGHIVVRCSARDMKVPMSNVNTVANAAYFDSTDDTGESTDGDIEDENDWSDETGSISEEGSPMEISPECEDVEIEDDDAQLGVGQTKNPLDGGNSSSDAEMHGLSPAGEKESSKAGTSATEIPESPMHFLILDEPPPSDHHFVNKTRDLTADVMRRITREHKILRSSLPQGIYVRTWENRLDLVRILIVGPRGTPYEDAPYMIDMFLGEKYPEFAPDTFFYSWKKGNGRINPNLYEDGKICLSLLGTWPANGRNENWSPQKSTILQILVSIMGLVLVKEPYYNEAGFEVLVGTEGTLVQSSLYSENTYLASREYVKIALDKNPLGVSSILQHLYLKKNGPQLLQKMISDCEKLINGPLLQNDDHRPCKWLYPGTKISGGALVLLRRQLEWMKTYLRSQSQ